MVRTLTDIGAYAQYFQRAFGDRAITLPRVASALADYQRTRMSGNSAWDRWQRGDARALSPSAHPPYMHDGSLPTLRDVILFYVRGGVRNPHLDTQVRPLRLSRGDIDALVDFLEALNGEGFFDRAPTAFPQ
jgi:cytochrome c peroxidase